MISQTLHKSGKTLHETPLEPYFTGRGDLYMGPELIQESLNVCPHNVGAQRIHTGMGSFKWEDERWIYARSMHLKWGDPEVRRLKEYTLKYPAPASTPSV